MRYYVGSMIKGEVAKYYNNLVNEISLRFELESLVKKQRIPHITLKSLFERDYVRDIEFYLKEFSEKHEAIKIMIDGFGNFEDKIIYLNIKKSGQIETIYNSFLKGLKSVPNISFGIFDNVNKKLHITLISKEMEGKFEEIWGYLSNITAPKFKIYLDNLTIFKKDKNRTLIHKTYKLLEN